MLGYRMHAILLFGYHLDVYFKDGIYGIFMLDYLQDIHFNVDLTLSYRVDV